MRTRRKRRPDDPKVPIDSFSDLAFLLNIFFILVTTVVRTMGLTQELPSSDKSAATPQKTTTIQLSEGVVSFNGEKVSYNQLRDRLMVMKLPTRNHEERMVVLEATGAVPYQEYFAVMTAISAAGGICAIVEEEKGGGK